MNSVRDAISWLSLVLPLQDLINISSPNTKSTLTLYTSVNVINMYSDSVKKNVAF